MCPISINITQRIEIRENEYMCGVTKLRNGIYVLCRLLSSLSPRHRIRVFEDRSPFRFWRNIKVNQIKDAFDVGSSEKENCLYVSDREEKFVWKITRERDGQHKIIKWLTTDYEPDTLSVSSDGQLLMVNDSSSMHTLMIYGTDGKHIRSVQLPRDIRLPRHAVETSIGNFVVIHRWTEQKRVKMSGISELTRDGQMVSRRFIPSNETQKLKDPRYLSVDSDDQVFVADTGNDRVILLDSDLKWNRILCPTEEEEDETKILMPHRLYCDEEKKQLIVGRYLGGVYVHTLSRH